MAKTNSRSNRKCGVLLPIFSLPSEYGIGTFSKEAYDFVDFLKEAGQSYWQILPLGPTSYGDSPYQSFSTFAGNPYFIDITALIEEGLLTKKEADACDFGGSEEYIDYEKMYRSRFVLLKKAYDNIDKAKNADKLKRILRLSRRDATMTGFLITHCSWHLKMTMTAEAGIPGRRVSVSENRLP